MTDSPMDRFMQIMIAVGFIFFTLLILDVAYGAFYYENPLTVPPESLWLGWLVLTGLFWGIPLIYVMVYD